LGGAFDGGGVVGLTAGFAVDFWGGFREGGDLTTDRGLGWALVAASPLAFRSVFPGLMNEKTADPLWPIITASTMGSSIVAGPAHSIAKVAPGPPRGSSRFTTYSTVAIGASSDGVSIWSRTTFPAES
jgi:hypothetical protein